jgi:pantoate--beta-alanine ligase
VLKKLVALLSMPTKIIIGETVREESGLAMSSRNLRLSDEQKQQATTIYQALSNIKKQVRSKTAGELQDEATATLLNNGFNKVDYIAIADAGTLQLLHADDKWSGQSPLVALAAAFIGDVRLIDNVLLS